MKTGLWGTVCAWVFAIITTSANSAIIYQQDNRFVDHTYNPNPPITPLAPFADFDDDFWSFEAGAFQTSSMTSTSNEWYWLDLCRL